MMTEVAKQIDAQVVESVLIKGDLKQLTPTQKVGYYKSVCESLGLNPLTQPFAYIVLNGKEQLYAKREATEQLRKIYGISIEIKSREVIEGCYIVTASAKFPNGRQDESTGVVTIEGLKGDNRANALMRAETKSKRRVTLSICGLGMLDETEIETIPAAAKSHIVEEQLVLEPVKPKSAVVAGQVITEVDDDAFEEEYITVPQRSMLARRFRESLREEIQPEAEELRHQALVALGRSGLFKSKFIDADGNPSVYFVLAHEYEQVGKALVKAAKSA